LSKRLESIKCETVIIPIYVHSLFKQIYKDSKYGFIPEPGQSIKENAVVFKSIPHSGTNAIKLLKSMNVTDFASIIDNRLQFSSKPLTSKIKNGKVVDLRVHTLNNSNQMIDKTLQQNVEKAYHDYKSKWVEVFKELFPIFNREFSTHVISKYYALTKGLSRSAYNLRDLCYLIEVKIVGKDITHLGDKLANRYANKGIVSLILPDELRPYALHSKKPIDYITGPLSVISRMNFG